jgi:hypothetical protein
MLLKCVFYIHALIDDVIIDVGQDSMSEFVIIMEWTRWRGFFKDQGSHMYTLRIMLIRSKCKVY